MSIAGVTRALLVRHLDRWVPGAVPSPHGATFLQASATSLDADVAEAALRACAEFGDRLRRRRLTLLFTAPDITDLQARLDTVQRELKTPPELTVHVLTGPVPVLLKALGAASGPLLSMIDGLDPAAVATGKPAEVITVDIPRVRLTHFDLTAGVVLVSPTGERHLGFGTRSAKSLEAFKDELWTVDAGVRYRDPNDPDSDLIDVTPAPDPDPLRRALLALLGTGGQTVTELKRYALTETVYRATDAVEVITALLQSGTVTRTPADGRLGGDVTIRIAG